MFPCTVSLRPQALLVFSTSVPPSAAFPRPQVFLTFPDMFPFANALPVPPHISLLPTVIPPPVPLLPDFVPLHIYNYSFLEHRLCSFWHRYTASIYVNDSLIIIIR